MNSRTDVVLVNPGDRKQVYQELGDEFAAIEPPFWVAAIAAFLRAKNFEVCIVDADAENMTPYEVACRVREVDPLLCSVIVYGSNPSASTSKMTIAGRICAAVRENTDVRVAIGGLHPSALPKRTLEEEPVDFVIEGEGPYTLESLLGVLRNVSHDFSRVPGLWYREDGLIRNNPRAPLIQNLDEGLPIAAWDLLPMRSYRAHNWHCFEEISNRTPYGAIYTSLGCPFNCVFCCINAPFGKRGIRYRSPRLVVEEIGVLVRDYGLKNLKIADELFVLNEKHYMGIIDLILEEGYPLNIWGYARLDTIDYTKLDKMKRAGINWLGLGIESGSELIRNGANKQSKVKDVVHVVRRLQDAGIRVGSNFIFGLPDDSRQTVNATLDLAFELNTEWANFYCAMAYPGSRLYDIAVSQGWELPKEWHGYSQHSYDTFPLATKYLSAREVLEFRDDAFHAYFENPAFLDMVEWKFGDEVRSHISRMTRTRLRRRILEQQEST